MLEEPSATSPPPKRVLVVDDEEGILELVEYHLGRAGFDVVLAHTGLDGYRLATETRPDLVILDLMLPDMDGFEVCRRIRRRSDVPVLMLTARTDDVDKIVGLEIGADDYVTKPFNPRELVARVRALLRRVGHGGEGAESPSERLEFGDLVVDLAHKNVQLRGEELQLSPTEFSLLEVFVQGPERVWSRHELLDRVWGEDFVGDPRVVDVYVRYLREKLGDDASAPRWIETVRGMGYRWRARKRPRGARAPQTDGHSGHVGATRTEMRVSDIDATRSDGRSGDGRSDDERTDDAPEPWRESSHREPS